LTVSQRGNIAASPKQVFDMHNSSSAKHRIVFTQYLKQGALFLVISFAKFAVDKFGE
jgi:hypothetical protein